MRVLAFVSEFPRFHGAHRSFLQLLRGLPGRGVEVVVAFPAEGLATRLYREAGLAVEVLPARGVQTRFGKDMLRWSKAQKAAVYARDVLPFSSAILTLAKRLDVDLIHTMTVRSTLALGPLPRLAGLPVVTHLRGLLTPYGALERAALTVGSTRIVCVAEAVRDCLPSYARSRARVVYNAVDADSVRGFEAGPARRAALGAGEDDVVLAIIGSVGPDKGHHQLLAALARVAPPPRGRLHLVVVGAAADPAYEALLRTRADALPHVAVHFVGYTENPFAYHAAADVLVVPSITREVFTEGGHTFRAASGEGLPRTALEAMYLGRPVVAYDMAGVAEAVEHGRTGLLVREHDRDGLADALSALVHDPDRRRRLGEAGRAVVRARFGPQATLDGIVRVYAECL